MRALHYSYKSTKDSISSPQHFGSGIPTEALTNETARALRTLVARVPSTPIAFGLFFDRYPSFSWEVVSSCCESKLSFAQDPDSLEERVGSALAAWEIELLWPDLGEGAWYCNDCREVSGLKDPVLLHAGSHPSRLFDFMEANGAGGPLTVTLILGLMREEWSELQGLVKEAYRAPSKGSDESLRKIIRVLEDWADEVESIDRSSTISSPEESHV